MFLWIPIGAKAKPNTDISLRCRYLFVYFQICFKKLGFKLCNGILSSDLYPQPTLKTCQNDKGEMGVPSWCGVKPYTLPLNF